MSTLTDYYKDNQDENPYTMEQTKHSSRVVIIKELIEEHTPKTGSILDVGCGDMYLSSALPDYKWTGIDINLNTNSKSALKVDLESTPYPLTEQYDTIICSEVLEHLFDPVKVTKEIHRLLKPNGTYILSTPNFDWIEHFTMYFRPVVFNPKQSWTKEHIHFYTLESHDSILQEAGFKTVYYTGGDPHFGLFFKRARAVLSGFLKVNLNLDQDRSQIECDKLISEMFKKFCHTIIIVAKKI